MNITHTDTHSDRRPYSLIIDAIADELGLDLIPKEDCFPVIDIDHPETDDTTVIVLTPVHAIVCRIRDAYKMSVVAHPYGDLSTLLIATHDAEGPR